MLLVQKWKQQRPQQGVQADFVQICFLQVECYIMKSPHGDDQIRTVTCVRLDIKTTLLLHAPSLYFFPNIQLI